MEEYRLVNENNIISVFDQRSYRQLVSLINDHIGNL